MKILMLVNWKVEYCSGQKPPDRQPPDYVQKGKDYWFFRYFENHVTVDVVDISSLPAIEHFEKEKLRFYVLQTIKVLPRFSSYDLILSHGMQSGVILSLVRLMYPSKAKHVVFDIGSFNSASESGVALRLMQRCSKSIDGIIYHTSRQKEYYQNYFPWLVSKSRFIPFGTDFDFFTDIAKTDGVEPEKPDTCFILSIGYAKRDWNTLIQAFKLLCLEAESKGIDKKGLKLKLIGKVDPVYQHDQVEMKQVIPIHELICEINKADFCVLPLKEYNYSYGQMTLLQQMAIGKAVIVSRVSSMLDYAEDNKTVLFYEPEDIEDLKRKMEQLILEPEWKEELGKQAALSVKSDFNEQLMARRIENYLLELSDHKHKETGNDK